MTSVRYVRAKALIDSLTKACEKNEISPDDLITDVEIIGDDMVLDGFLGGCKKNVPAGSLRLFFRSADPDAKMDTEIYVLWKDKKEETQE